MSKLDGISYAELRAELAKLPQTWYADLIGTLCAAAKEKNVFKPEGIFHLVSKAMNEPVPGLEAIGNEVCRDLTPGWKISVEMENGAADVELIGPNGVTHLSSNFADVEATLEEKVMAAIQFAKTYPATRCPHCGRTLVNGVCPFEATVLRPHR